MLGRLTLNPLPHIDPIGSVLLPGVLALMHAPVLGWAKPVPVNPRNYRDYKRGDILVSLAGVVTNFLLAIVFALLVAAIVWLARLVPSLLPTWQVLVTMAHLGVTINVILMLFNLLPIPPLDGSHVFYYLLPPAWGARYRELNRYGMLILFGVLFLVGFSFLSRPVTWLTNVLLVIPRLLT